MGVVVSDTTPLHYLILVDHDFVLRDLYQSIFIPPAVFEELKHPLAPVKISEWAANLPSWVTVSAPGLVPERFEGLDIGEGEALALATDLHADLILLDDKVARRAASRESLKVKGTLGIVVEAAKANLLDFVQTVERLQRTSMYLDPDVVDEAIRDYRRSII